MFHERGGFRQTGEETAGPIGPATAPAVDVAALGRTQDQSRLAVVFDEVFLELLQEYVPKFTHGVEVAA